MSVAGRGGRRAGLADATEAWAWRSGAHPEPAAPSNRGPKPADRGSERPRLDPRARPSDPAQKAAPRPAAASPLAGVPESLGREAAPKQGNITCWPSSLLLHLEGRPQLSKR